MKNDYILECLRGQSKLCVMATSSQGGKTECAVLAYAITDDLKFIISTHKNTRKYKNILENYNVSLVFGWAFDVLNIQCDGTARIIEEEKEYTNCENFFFSHNPQAKQFKTADTVFIEIKPTWMRITDFMKTPPSIDEKSF